MRGFERVRTVLKVVNSKTRRIIITCVATTIPCIPIVPRIHYTMHSYLSTHPLYHAFLSFHASTIPCIPVFPCIHYHALLSFHASIHFCVLSVGSTAVPQSGARPCPSRSGARDVIKKIGKNKFAKFRAGRRSSRLRGPPRSHLCRQLISSVAREAYTHTYIYIYIYMRACPCVSRKNNVCSYTRICESPAGSLFERHPRRGHVQRR